MREAAKPKEANRELLPDKKSNPPPKNDQEGSSLAEVQPGKQEILKQTGQSSSDAVKSQANAELRADASSLAEPEAPHPEQEAPSSLVKEAEE